MANRYVTPLMAKTPERVHERKDEAGDGGTDDAREVQLDGLQRDGADEVALADQLRKHRRERRRVQCVADAEGEHADEQHGLRRVVAGDDERHHERQDHLLDLAPDQQPAAIDGVGQEPADDRQEQQRTELREAEQRDVAG